MHLIRQAAEVRISTKKKSNTPVRIAPIILVAAKLIAKRRIARNIVPKMPMSNAVRAEQRHLEAVPCIKAADTNANAKNATAIPNTTHKNTGATVITAAKVRNAVTTPIKRLTITDAPRHSRRLSQQNNDIFFHLNTIYAGGCLGVSFKIH